MQQNLVRRVDVRLLRQQQLEVLQPLAPVQVDPELRQAVEVVHVDLLLAQDPGDLGEESLERPHSLGIDFKEAGQQRGHVFADA